MPSFHMWSAYLLVSKAVNNVTCDVLLSEADAHKPATDTQNSANLMQHLVNPTNNLRRVVCKHGINCTFVQHHGKLIIGERHLPPQNNSCLPPNSTISTSLKQIKHKSLQILYPCIQFRTLHDILLHCVTVWQLNYFSVAVYILRSFLLLCIANKVKMCSQQPICIFSRWVHIWRHYSTNFSWIKEEVCHLYLLLEPFNNEDMNKVNIWYCILC